ERYTRPGASRAGEVLRSTARFMKRSRPRSSRGTLTGSAVALMPKSRIRFAYCDRGRRDVAGDEGVLIVAEDTFIQGKIRNCRRIEVYGQVDGELSAEAVHIHEGGRF